MAAVGQSQSCSLAGTALKPFKSFQVSSRPPQSWIFTAVVILCLFACTARHQFVTKNCDDIPFPAEASQHLLFTQFLNNGHARVPVNVDSQINPLRLSLGLMHFALILLLAGDVEQNPGPLPADIASQVIAQLAQLVPLAQLLQLGWITQLASQHCVSLGASANMLAGLSCPAIQQDCRTALQLYA